MDEIVDILIPPHFLPNGQTKTRIQAYTDGDWIPAFNLWIVTREPQPSIIYQQRSPQVTRAPGRLDATVGGHYQAGETLTDGLREAKEEIGKDYSADQINHLGRKIYVGFNTNGTSRNNLIEIYLIEDNSPLHTYHLQPDEVYAITACPIINLLQAHTDPTYTFQTQALTATGQTTPIQVSRASFPENWDNYHHKIALLADRYFKNDPNLIY